MITSVEIYNFQSHKHTLVNLVEGVNVIIGPSDAGKSSIFRAVNWVRSNRPLGDAYRSEWGGDTRAILTTDDGNVVERLRTDRDNMYIVNGIELKAFGTEPPEEVIKALRIDTYNVQTQDDPPFLLSMSPGEAAQVLNKAASIDVIDRAVGGLNREYRRITQRMGVKEEQLKKQEKELESFHLMGSIEALMDAVEEGSVELEEMNALHTRMSRLRLRAVELTDNLSQYRGLDRAVASVVSCQDSYSEVSRAAEALSRGVRIVDLYDGLKAQMDGLTLLSKGEALLGKVQQSYQFMMNLTTARDSLVKISGNREYLEDSIEELDMEILQLREEYAENAPDDCPLCGGVMPKGAAV